MASSSGSLDNLPLKFHTVHSPKVRVSRDGIRAACPNLGVVFSNRPLRPLEKISIRIPKFSETFATSAIIFFGVSEVDPHLLNSSVTKPNLSCEDFLTLYEHPALRVSHALVKPNGNDEVEDGTHIASVMLVRTLAFISFNDDLQQTIKDVSRPLWLVFMLSLPGIEEIRIEIGDGKNNHVARGTEMPTSVMTVHYGRLSPTHEFHHYTGRNVFIPARKTGLRFRQNHFGANGYLFLQSSVTIGTGVVLKVRQMCNNTEGSIGFGLTSCNPDSLEGHELPDDPDTLLDRPEYWVYKPDIANGIAAYDELCISTLESGVVEMSRNGGPPVFLVYVDTSVPLYMFFNLVGSVKEISLMGSFFLPGTATTSSARQESDQDVSVLEVIYEGPRQEALSARSAVMPRAIAPVVSASITTANASRSTVNTGAVTSASRSQEDLIEEDFAAFTRDRTSRSRHLTERRQEMSSARRAGSAPSIALTSSVSTPAINNVIRAGTSHSRIQENVRTEQIVPNQAELAAPGPPRGHSEGFFCIICMDNRISHIVIECGHMCLCSQCAAAYDKKTGCPICRGKVRKIIQVYGP